MDMPPSRYRVVEQGRRLVVIDTLAGEPVRPVPASMPEMPGETRRRMEAPRPQSRAVSRARPEPSGRYAGGGEVVSFVTAPWFDNEGPRTIQVSKNGQTQIGVAVVVAVVIAVVLAILFSWALVFPIAFLLFHAKTRVALRSAATTWITALDSSED